MSASAKQRIKFIDLAKGICILLVVLNHSGCSPYPLNLLRLPLYFILSGLFFKDYGGYFVTIIKKINKLLIPCLFFYILAIGVTVVICTAVKGKIEINVLDIFTQKEFHNIYLWFLFSLFWNNLIFLMLKRTLIRNSYIISTIVVMAFIGVYMSKHNIKLPLFIDSVFFTLPYFFFGYWLRQTPFLTNKDFNIKNILLFVFMVAVVFVGSYAFGQHGIDMRVCEFSGNLILTYITSISFVCSLLTITKWIDHLPIISYAGRYSLIILGIHFPMQYLIMLILKNIGVEGTPLLNFISITTLSILSIPIFVKYFPYFTAQKDLIKYEFLVKIKTKINFIK